MKIGVDLVKIKRIEKLLSDKNTVRKIFNPEEISDNFESLAGKFAAKEAYFKALGQKDDWLDLTIKNNTSGEPFFVIQGKPQKNILLSISHEEDYAVAVVIIK